MVNNIGDLHMKFSGIGGQAVMEGVMMRNGNDYAIAVRLSDGSIHVDKKKTKGQVASGIRSRSSGAFAVSFPPL